MKSVLICFNIFKVIVAEGAMDVGSDTFVVDARIQGAI